MDGPEAHQLAMAMERFCVGNDDVFAHRTNINPKSRLIVYNLKPMPKNMKEIGRLNFKKEVPDKKNIKQYLFEGYKISYYAENAFDSDDESWVAGGLVDD